MYSAYVSDRKKNDRGERFSDPSFLGELVQQLEVSSIGDEYVRVSQWSHLRTPSEINTLMVFIQQCF